MKTTFSREFFVFSMLLLFFSELGISAPPNKNQKRPPKPTYVGHSVADANEKNYPPVLSYLIKTLRVDPQEYDMGEKIKAQLERMDVLEPPAQHVETLAKVHQQVFSELSKDSLGRLVRGLQETRYPNVLVLGEAGVGKSFLVEQVAWLFAYGVMPDYLRERLNITDPNSPASLVAADFLARTNVIIVNEVLLTQQGSKRGAIASQEVRIKNTLADLFRAAKAEYNNGKGNRTIFVFEELATLPEYVHGPLKALLDAGGYQPRGFVSFGRNDPGYHVIALTTNDEYLRMVKGDSATDRRFPTKIRVLEPSDSEVFKVVRKIADQEWSQHYRGITIKDDAIEFMVHMKNYLNWPPLAAPHSVISGVNSLFVWKMQYPGNDPLVISQRDAQTFFQNRSGLSDIWFEGPNGEPPLTGLAERVKELVVNHDVIIEKIAQRIKVWHRLGQGREPPVFFLGGPTGSGKDTIVMAFNLVLFGHTGKTLMFNLAGKKGFAVDALLEGPPLGNHSDDRAGHLQAALDASNGMGMPAFNETYDMSSAEFDKLKVLIERGELRPAGVDSRARPLRYPTFILGQFGEGLYFDDSKQPEHKPDLILTNEKIDSAFTEGKTVMGESFGAVPQALLDRAKKNGGAYIAGPVASSRYPEIIAIWLKVLTAQLMKTNNLILEVDPELIQMMVRVSVDSGLRVRGLYGIMSDFTEGAISGAIDRGLPLSDTIVKLSAGEDYKTVVLEASDFEEKMVFTPHELIRLQGGCQSIF